jgi:hypothetical protein
MTPIVELWIDESELTDRNGDEELSCFPKQFEFTCPSCGINPTAWTNGVDFVIPTFEMDKPINVCYHCGARIKLRVRKSDPADHLLEVLSPHEIIYKDADHVASEFERLRKIVRDCDVKLLAVVMSYWKWEQNAYKAGPWHRWSLGRTVKECPLCILHYDENEEDCCDCSPSLKKCAGSRDGGSPYVETVNRSDKKPLLAALKKAIAYEIENHDDYNPEALRAALAGGENPLDVWINECDIREHQIFDYCCPSCSAKHQATTCAGTWRCPSCNRKLIICIRESKEEIPEVIADENEYGVYLYNCPYCSNKDVNCSSGDPIQICPSARKKYKIRTRTLYERWAEEKTPLYVVYRDAKNSPFGIYKAKCFYYEPLQAYWIKVPENDNDEFSGTDIESAKNIAYLGESKTKAFEIACEKWGENETPLIFGTQDTERLSIGKAFIRNGYVWRGIRGEYAFESMNIRAAVRGKDLIILTPNYDSIEAWLKEKLVNDEC